MSLLFNDDIEAEPAEKALLKEQAVVKQGDSERNTSNDKAGCSGLPMEQLPQQYY